MTDRRPEEGSFKPGLTTTTVFEAPRADLEFLPSDSHRVQIEVVGGPMDGRRRRVAKTAFNIGRGESNDMPLVLDGTVSSQHARILHEGGLYWLEDLDSRNGTYIGEQKVTSRTPIGPGSLFLVGGTRLELTAC